MLELFNNLSKKYYLQLGDYRFSPLTQLTSGMSLEYCHRLKENQCSKQPFLFCLPEKKAGALWISVSLLTNYYLEDYVSLGDEGISVKKDDKVFIFGCVAQVERVQNGSIYLKFKDQGGLQLNDKLRNQLSLAPHSRVLNNFKKYQKERSKSRKNRNPISKILYPKDEVFINQRNLKSKILLVAGRGQVREFHDFLETLEIYGEKLRKVFPEGENLIITPDLKRYKVGSNICSEKSEEEFIQLLLKAFGKNSFREVKHSILEILEIYKVNDKITKDFDYLFSKMIDDYIDILPEVKILDDNYPGYSEDLTDEFRAVVINDVSQLSDYPNTVNYFLQKNIPVIVFSDRKVVSIKEIDFYKNLFQNNQDFFRINWNKKKLNALKQFSKEPSRNVDLHKCENGTHDYNDSVSSKLIPSAEDYYIDQELWNQTLRYEGQIINIESYQGCQLDTFAPILVKHVRELDEFEILQKSFYKNLLPALYALKNSPSSNECVRKLINTFCKDFELVADQLPNDVSQDFLKTIAEAEVFRDNSKEFESEVRLFTIRIPNDLVENFTIPLDSREVYLPNEYRDRMVFTGFPFSEFGNNYLINSVNKFYVPNIELRCWPYEASLTYNYLKRRIKGGYFNDFLPEGIHLDRELRIESDDDIESEIDKMLHCSYIASDSYSAEENLSQIYQFKYKGFLSSQDSSTIWKVSCDVLNFENGDFMFLRKGSTILCLSEDAQGKMKVSKKSADQFIHGDVVFRFIKDRTAYLEISKRDREVRKSYEVLDTWKSVLQDLYSRHGNSTRNLESFLTKQKSERKLRGNPVHANLERWLFDEEVISPDEDNLRLILSSAEVPNLEEQLALLEKAYKIATAHRISLSTRIKNEISSKLSKKFELNGDFEINVDGAIIEVETRTISSVDRNGIEVDYHNTRKILC